jgi:trans-aconitate methyltransferase
MATVFAAGNAGAYERYMGRWSRRLAVPFLDFAATGNPRSVLDVGCGTGSLTFVLAQRWPQAKILGIDSSQAFIDAGRAQAPDVCVTFQQADAAVLPLADQSFDATLSLLVLNLIPEYERAAREMARVTKAGGVVTAAVWDVRGGMPHQRMLLDAAAVFDTVGGAAFRTNSLSTPLAGPGELAALWTKIGLNSVVQTYLTIRVEFQSFADYWEPFLGGVGRLGPYIAGLSPDTRARIERHLRLSFLMGATDGPRSFPATALAVRGVR